MTQHKGFSFRYDKRLQASRENREKEGIHAAHAYNT